MVCRGLLLMLHRAGALELPPVRQTSSNPLVKRKRLARILIDTTPIVGGLKQLQPLEFQQVRRTAEEGLFNSLLEENHYLGYEQPVGEHLKFLIWGAEPAHRGSGLVLGASPSGQPGSVHRLEERGTAPQHPVHCL